MERIKKISDEKVAGCNVTYGRQNLSSCFCSEVGVENKALFTVVRTVPYRIDWSPKVTESTEEKAEALLCYAKRGAEACMRSGFLSNVNSHFVSKLNAGIAIYISAVVFMSVQSSCL